MSQSTSPAGSLETAPLSLSGAAYTGVSSSSVNVPEVAVQAPRPPSTSPTWEARVVVSPVYAPSEVPDWTCSWEETCPLSSSVEATDEEVWLDLLFFLIVLLELEDDFFMTCLCCYLYSHVLIYEC